MEHTPGPWHVNGVDAILSVNRSVAKVYHPDADAKLIAQAPALLEALEEIEGCAEEAPAWDDEIKADIAKLARAAIEAAKGDA